MECVVGTRSVNECASVPHSDPMRVQHRSQRSWAKLIQIDRGVASTIEVRCLQIHLRNEHAGKVTFMAYISAMLGRGYAHLPAFILAFLACGSTQGQIAVLEFRPTCNEPRRAAADIRQIPGKFDASLVFARVGGIQQFTGAYLTRGHAALQHIEQLIEALFRHRSSSSPGAVASSAAASLLPK